MNSVSENKDYSLRVENKEENEFGALIDGFNHMVQQVQIRDKQISEYNSSCANDD
jgi:methyl-accepting chemotaxis protein